MSRKRKGVPVQCKTEKNIKTSCTALRKAKRENAIETVNAEDKSFVHKDNFEIKIEQKENELEL